MWKDYMRGARPLLVVAGALGTVAALVATGGRSSASAQVEPQPPHLSIAREAIAADPALLRAPSRIDYALLDERLRQLVERPDMVGMAVAIIENGEISFVKGYGLTEAKGAEPVGVRTVFRWASLSKGVAGTLVAELAAEGKLSLDDPISRYSKTLRLPRGGEQIATVADVLSHRVGLSHNAFDDRLEGGQDPRVIRTSLGGLSALCQPGTCHSYQNVAFDSVSEVVEAVTGRPYAEEVRDRLFRPLGMQDASLTRIGLMSSRSWARPHVGQTTVSVEDPYYRVPAAGGVNSSIMDLALWMRAQIGLTPRVVSPAVLDAAHMARVDTGRRNTAFARAMGPSRYALGWRDYDFEGHRLIGHQGAVRGYRSTILFDPRTRAGVAVLWNSQSGAPSRIQLEVLDMLYGLGDRDWLRLDGGVGGHATITAR
ncbi:serine hydrolase domain-containing protein [Sphingomonas flavalba]|uniref:serine hydrolase domain-containing protein n=1 Tax=Sphingomonas flavalba TaxID=2559804 RepID=UPI00109E06FA|nr:serine hydrolase domain-containing protein [Sphingomonas flavalba]